MENLEEFINFIVPNDFYYIKTEKVLKYIEIEGKSMQEKYTVRISEEKGDLQIYIHNIYEGDTDRKSFKKGDISGMSEYLENLVQKAMPNLNYSLWLQGKAE